MIDQASWFAPRLALSSVLIIPLCLTASATTFAPPMLDITRQCDTMTKHRVDAMSECVVAESEARSELLQKWDRLSDPVVEKCLKANRKAKRYPYSTLAKCLAGEGLPVPAPAAAGAK